MSVRCRNCGTEYPGDVPIPEHCGKCPPWPCEQCGEMCAMSDLCACWTSLEGMPLADIKALFADIDLSVVPTEEA